MNNTPETNPNTDGCGSLPLATGSAPSFRATISRDGSELWNWAGDMGAWIQREARIAELRKEIRVCGTVCGDCEKWMKSRECPREQPGTGKRSGYSVGPSMNGAICNAYVETSSATQRRTKLTCELESILSAPNAKVSHDDSGNAPTKPL